MQEGPCDSAQKSGVPLGWAFSTVVLDESQQIPWGVFEGLVGHEVRIEKLVENSSRSGIVWGLLEELISLQKEENVRQYGDSRPLYQSGNLFSFAFGKIRGSASQEQYRRSLKEFGKTSLGAFLIQEREEYFWRRLRTHFPE